MRKREKERKEYLLRRNLEEDSSEKDLSSKVTATSAILGLVGGSFFLSTNVTGNVIGLSNTTSSWIGGALILIGLIALGFWVKNRKINKKVVVRKISKLSIKSRKKK